MWLANGDAGFNAGTGWWHGLLHKNKIITSYVLRNLWWNLQLQCVLWSLHFNRRAECDLRKVFYDLQRMDVTLILNITYFLDLSHPNVIFFWYDLSYLLYIQLICMMAARCALSAFGGQAADLIQMRNWETSFRIYRFEARFSLCWYNPALNSV